VLDVVDVFDEVTEVPLDVPAEEVAAPPHAEKHNTEKVITTPSMVDIVFFIFILSSPLSL
jgi:hypothetical protein